ncbi:MAG: biotin/lipoyl-binding protein [Clostridia bacterium]|nr:biotin/lipoyl-binding protein [Clostridia bacterium]
MKAYRVNVNGNVYEITLEVIDKEDIKAPAEAKKVEAAPAQEAPAAPAVAGNQTITAPMPGNILKVNVSNGQAVKKGDILMILEAMKMENEILAPADATVASVNVSANQTVESGTVLCTLN